MAFTSIEAIAQKLSEDRKERLESILMVSGSEAIVKNEYNITVVDDTNVASSLLFKELKKDKYDEEELLKAIDVNVIELKPNIPKQRKDLVPKPLYDEEVKRVEDLRREVERLNLIQTELSAIISELEAQVINLTNEQLVLDQTNDVLVNQSNTLSETINDFAAQIQTALQKSVEESILRASLQAQNSGFKAQIEALIKQIDSLNAIIKGLQSQLGAVQNQSAITQGTQAQAMAAGADVVNEVVIVKVKDKTEESKPIIWGKIRANGGNKFVNGDYIDFTNNDKKPVTINISFVPVPTNMSVFSVGENSFSLGAGEQKQVKLTINEGPAGGRDGVNSKKKWIGWSGTADHKGGSMKISVVRDGGSTKDKTYETGFTKTHPDSF
jgi:uncharacterized Fe-S cluster-containing radical SAM superfamily protein